MIKRLFAGILALACVLGLATAPARADDDTIKSIRDAGVLKVAMAESLPMQFKNPASGEWEGYNVDMAQSLAKILNVKLQIVDATWPTLIPGLLAKQYDIVMVDMWATPERAMSVMFTDAYNLYGWSVMVQADSAYKTWEDLDKNGVLITTLSGTADEQTAQRMFPNAEVKGLVSENVNAPRMEVANGRADAVVTDLLNIKMFMSQNPTAKVRILQEDRVMTPTGLAYAVRPGDPHFLNFLNTWIHAVRDGGTADDLRKKWISDFKWPAQ